MTSRETPVAYVHLAVLGLLFGLSMAVGGSLLLHDQWRDSRENPSASDHVIVRGRISDAQWRSSAVPQGPTRYLQVRIDGDPRGFLVSEQALSGATLRFLGISNLREGSLSELTGREGSVRIDSALQNEPTPYVSALRVDGRTVVSEANTGDGLSSSWRQRILGLLYGAGTLIGIGLISASSHHLVVCLRYWQRDA